MVLYFGAVYGGPELRGSPVDRAIGKLVRLRGPAAQGELGSLDIVFHVPGSVFRAEFTGVRLGRFSRKLRLLQVQVAVPADVAESPEPYMSLVNYVREAVVAAAASFAKAGIAYPLDRYLELIARLAQAEVH